jgi:hypothetical protein
MCSSFGLSANGLVAPDNGSQHGTWMSVDGVADTFPGPPQTSYEVYNPRDFDEQQEEPSQRSHSQTRSLTPTSVMLFCVLDPDSRRCLPSPLQTSPLVKCPVPGCQESFKPGQKAVADHFRSHPGMTVCPWPYCSRRVNVGVVPLSPARRRHP